MSADKYKIDSHKLMYHVRRVDQWLSGKDIYPIYAEVGLFGGCNHRCIFCAFDFLKYNPDMLEIGCLKRFVKSASRNGVKAVLFSGEGEPLLHKNFADIIAVTVKNGIDAALVTNGVRLEGLNREVSLEYLTWIKISLDAGTKETHSFVHGTRRSDFGVIIKNLKEAVKIRNRRNYRCAIGVQALFLPENEDEIVKLAGLLNGIGVDYLAVKPYSPYSLSANKFSVRYKNIDLVCLEKELGKYSGGDFRIILRSNAMVKINRDKDYGRCLGLPFAVHIAATGDVYPCNFFVGNKEFVYGNIYKNDFAKIWEGRRRKKITKFICEEWDVKKCRKCCRLDEINRYLWELKNPGRHVNFI